MIVIGADTHKRSHALAAVDSGTGVVVDELQITADEDGHLHALAWAERLGAEMVWALEDCRLVAGRLERALIAAGQRVIRVPPRLMGQSRRGERETGKSDRIDARAIARAVLKDGIEHFPAAFLDERRARDPAPARSPQRLDRRAQPADQPPALAARGPLPGARGRTAVAVAAPRAAHHQGRPPPRAHGADGTVRGSPSSSRHRSAR